jgi:hypothetical protein
MSKKSLQRKPSKTALALEQAQEKAAAINPLDPNLPAFLQRWATRYSDRNCRLLYVQRSTATELHTFNGWITEGRTVRKGESAIVLMAPRTKEVETSEGDTEEKRWIRPIALFDISQTDKITNEENAA